MQKILCSFAGILAVCLASGLALSAAQPAPAEKGVVKDAPETAGQNGEEIAAQNTDAPPDEGADDAGSLEEQIADLEAKVQSLSESLKKFSDSQKEVEQLKGKIAILEGDNTTLLDRVKTLETEKDKLANRVKLLEGDNATLQERLVKMETDGPQERTAAKPGFVKSAVRFYNHEGHPVKMNVNGVWHTVKQGENQIWVPYGPVYIYRYNGSEPRTFSNWKPHSDGFVMDFDIGTPAKK